MRLDQRQIDTHGTTAGSLGSYRARFALQAAVRLADEAKIDQFEKAALPEHPQLRSLNLLRVDNTEAILLVLFDSHEALDDFSRNIAAPWFAENIRQYLSGSVSRSVGEIVAGSIGTV